MTASEVTGGNQSNALMDPLDQPLVTFSNISHHLVTSPTNGVGWLSCPRCDYDLGGTYKSVSCKFSICVRAIVVDMLSNMPLW